MKKSLCVFLSFIISLCASAQAQQNLDSIKLSTNNENIVNKSLYNDSLVSSYVIFIKKEVKLHKHEQHSEHVYILEGEGEMILGDKTIVVKKGDLIFIPKNTPHSLKVTSSIPVKVMSIQAPFFDGKDRIFIN